MSVVAADSDSIWYQQINVLAVTKAEIAKGQYGKCCALDEEDGQIGIIEQAL